MPSPSRHDRTDAAEAEHPKAVKTFVFEVSAGRSKGVGDATAGRAMRVDASASDAIDFSLTEDAADAEHDEDRVLSFGNEPLSIAEGATTAVRTRRSARKRVRPTSPPTRTTKPAEAASATQPRRLSSWSVSVVVHALLASAVSLIAITPAVRHEVMDLVMGPPMSEELDATEIVDPDAQPTDVVDADAESALEQFTGEESETLIDPGTPTLGMEAGAGALGDLTDDMALVTGGGGANDGPPGGRGGSGGGMGNGTGGSAGFGEGRGGSPTADFFGAKIDGNRIVFVLDNSGSMQGGRLETVIAELLKSVDALTPKQRFYVVFYSDLAYPLFYPDPAQDFVAPTDRNKAELARWLDTVELCLGDAVLDAMAGVIAIQPDTVFLLGDGRIQGEKKMRALLEASAGDFVIHTVGVGLGKNAVASRRNLQMIAEANGGDFREAEVPEEMRELALTNPRPYHNQTPGPIWGLKVKGWGKR